MMKLMKLLSAIILILCSVMFTLSHADTNPVSSQSQPASVAEPAAPDASGTNDAKTATSVHEEKVMVARVVWVKGAFSATMPGNQEARKLKLGDNIYLNDTLITDKLSEAQIIFTDNSTMTFRPESKLYINQYNYAPPSKENAEKKSAGKYILDLITGGFRTITGMVAKQNPNDYAVNTPVATIGVRGTEYSLVYKVGQDLYIKRYSGIPCMSNNATKNQSKSVNAGGGGGVSSSSVGGGEVCLDKVKQYGVVSSENEAPVAIVEQPQVFQTDVEIVPVSFSQAPGEAPLTNIEGTGSAGSSSGTSFCIQ
ncbi:MAG TPA: FecR family protein [Gammaproteobacteria bacterium]|jgi:hypothetical protein|nr:FecR family protein [Gammaproteobacteria bacterium]